MNKTEKNHSVSTRRSIAKSGVVRSGVAAVAIIALGAGTVACSSDDDAKSTETPAVQTTAQTTESGGTSPDTAMPDVVPNMDGHITMTSAESKLLKVGPEAERTYGWNKLVGPTSTQLGDFDVEMLGNVDYLSGNGAFFGFLSFTAPSGDMFGMRMSGQATVNEDGSSTLHADLNMIGGTGAYANVTGSGTFDGSREAVVGAPIEIDVKLALEGMPTS